MIIEVFDDLYDATLFIEVKAEEAYRADEAFRAEIFRTIDGRWRVGISNSVQLEMDV